MIEFQCIFNGEMPLFTIGSLSGGSKEWAPSPPSDGMFVTFEEVEGMAELNDSAPRPIKVLSPFSFSIEDTSGYGAYSGTKVHCVLFIVLCIFPFNCHHPPLWREFCLLKRTRSPRGTSTR